MITAVLVHEKQSVVDLVCTFLTFSFLSREENLTVSRNEVFGIELLITATFLLGFFFLDCSLH